MPLAFKCSASPSRSGSDHIEVVDGLARAAGSNGDDDARNARQQLAVACGGSPALRIPFIQMPQLDAKKRGLDRIEAAVVPFEIVVVLLHLPVLAQHLDRARHLLIVGRHGARFAAGPRFFPG